MYVTKTMQRIFTFIPPFNSIGLEGKETGNGKWSEVHFKLVQIKGW